MIPAMTTDTRLEIERVLRADREAVFRCWTDLEHLVRWFGPAEHSTLSANVDLRVGGRYRIGMRKGETGPTHIVGGVYREISRPEKLVFTWAWETSSQPADETLVTVALHDLGGQTRLVLTQERFSSGAMREQHFEGWSSCLDRLVQVVGQ